MEGVNGKKMEDVMTPTLIIHNANIYTVDPDQPWAEAVACEDGHIVAVGQNDEILALSGPNTQRIDGQRRLVLPGLTDAHVHFLSYAIRRHQINLFGLTDFTEVRRRVAEGVAQVKTRRVDPRLGLDRGFVGCCPDGQVA